MKLVSLPYLKEVVFRLALFMNANAKNPQIEHYPCPKYVMIYRPDLYNLQVRKKNQKNPHW